MSTYLTFYLLPKKSKGSSDEPKPMSFVSFSGSSDFFAAFADNMNIAYSYHEGDKFTELTPDVIQKIIDQIKTDIDKWQNRLLTTYKLLPPADRIEQLNEIIEDEEYLNYMRTNLTRLKLIKDIAEEISYGYSAFEKLLCNIG